jgi:hypothetical protein
MFGPERVCRDRGGIFIRLDRQMQMALAVEPKYCVYADAPAGSARCANPVANTFERQAKHIKADRYVADRRRRESCHGLRQVSAPY